ncbi:MAG: ABC transporter ATP-binding protein [Alphaproteobacteria bacterium]|nr:MAG: ABC transporter ATP-binding protein [Alphaproteobacteria bacterium]
MTQLICERIACALDGRQILSDITFRCSGGAFIGLLGPNGAGKSTLLKVLARLLQPSAGQVLLDDLPAASWTAAAYARRVAYLPQERVIHWPVSVETIVALGRLPYRNFPIGPAPGDEEIVSAAMRAAEVQHLRQRTATRLSGGEQARVLLARVLAQQAEIILADEPTSALDPAHQISVMKTLHRLSERGAIVIVALHDLNLASRWCDRLLVLKEGTLAAEGPPVHVLSSRLMRQVYGVESRVIHDCGKPVVLPTAPIEKGGAEA